MKISLFFSLCEWWKKRYFSRTILLPKICSQWAMKLASLSFVLGLGLNLGLMSLLKLGSVDDQNQYKKKLFKK